MIIHEVGYMLIQVVRTRKPLSTSTLFQVWRSAVKELALLQQASGSLHAVAVSYLPSPFIAPVPPGPGMDVSSVLGWSLVEKTVRLGVWSFRGALIGEDVLSSLVTAGDWVKQGSYHTAWSVPLAFFVFLLIFVWARHSCRATNWRAVLATACWTVEGYRTPDEPMVC